MRGKHQQIVKRIQVTAPGLSASTISWLKAKRVQERQVWQQRPRQGKRYAYI
jgi:hypothetical protein